MSASYQEYLGGFQKQQERQLISLRNKTSKILQVAGVEKGHPPNRQKVATMFLGEDRYQLHQRTASIHEPLILGVGKESCRQEEPVTDLEESGEVCEARELARFFPNGAAVIGGQRAEPGKVYIMDLAAVTAVLGLWDPLLQAKRTEEQKSGKEAKPGIIGRLKAKLLPSR